MFAASGLDAGFLIDAENVIVQPQCCTSPAALVEIDDAASLAGEVRITREDPGRWRQGRSASCPSQRHNVVPLIFATRPLAIASWRSSATDHRARGRPRREGNSQATALIATTTLGGKAGWPPAARPLVQAWKSLGIEAMPPLTDDLARHAQACGDAVVAEPLARQEHDLGPHTSRYGDVYSLTRASSSTRSSSVSSITKGLRLGMAHPPR